MPPTRPGDTPPSATHGTKYRTQFLVTRTQFGAYEMAYPILVVWLHGHVIYLARGKVEVTTDEREDIIYGDIDLAEVDAVRSQIPVTSQRRYDLYSIIDKTQN